MKNRMFLRGMIAFGVAALCGSAAPVLRAQTPAPVVESQPAQLSQGVQEVLKLVRANVSDETITAFINTSRLPFNLSSSDVINLRQQGVSDTVINAMLNAQKAPQMAPQPAPATPAPDASNQTPADAAPAPSYDATAPVYQPAPVYSYTAPTFGYYNVAPYYWPAPSLSFGFGIGRVYGGHWGGGYHGYYRGGVRGGFYGHRHH